ncbi:MAG: zinc ribbon domain-containing protein [Actinobacteria bacterium]|nr:zinc ribbon domain-containing protein [Actinomycetota bacterium]
MASYDLRCCSCGKEFEVFVLGFLKDEAKVCPDCGGRNVEQRFTGFGGLVNMDGATRSSGGSRGSGTCSPRSGFS